MLKSCPDSVDVTELQFKLQCRLKIFENGDSSLFPDSNSLVTCASRYGLIFAGSKSNHFQVVQTQKLYNYNPKDKDVADYPRREIALPSTPRHLCVNCDCTILAVVVEKDQCPIVIFYDVLSFWSQNVKVIKELRLSSTPSVYVTEINWNPSLPAIFTACKSDGSLGLYELKGDSVDINELPLAAGATCFCWSPKGKQIAVGSKDGKITQYKPDLKAVKAIAEPKLEGSHTIISLQWVSNYQFIGVYHSVQNNASSIIVVDAPKTGEITYTNYEDICYSGSSRSPQFYLILQQNWNFLMVASANSTEVGVLGSNGEIWTQWIMSDTARAELPLSADHQETLPIGMGFDFSSVTPLPWGESSIPPCPMLCLLSNNGVLCCFNVVYLKEGIPTLCTPPDPVRDTSGINSFTTSSTIKPVEAEQPKLQGSLSKQPQSTAANTTFGMTTPQIQASKATTFSFPIASAALPVQSTPLVTGKTVFGGQASITPIKPQQSNALPLFGGEATISPIIKSTINPPTGQPTIDEKYSSIFASLNPTSSAQNNMAPVKPIVISASTVKSENTQDIVTTKPLETKPQEPVPKPQIVPPAESQQKQTSQVPDNKAETNEMLTQMTRDEWMYLEAELKILINLGKTIKVNVGTDQEKVSMIEQIQSLQEFVKEAVDISIGQSSEIHCLKQNLIQSWAWFEEAKSHYNTSKNEAVALLIKLQPLDSLSQKRLKDIEQLIYYVDSQISQASKTLDEQWDNFQDYAKKIHRVKMPTMEAIFQTMVRQNAVLQKQTYVLKDISMRLRRKTSNVSSFLLSLDKDLNLAEDLQELHLNPQNILQLQYEKVKKHTKNLSEGKARKLRNLLIQREVTRVTAVKPQLSSWAINQSPASRMRQSISKLGATLSPAVKTSVARNLDFVQSTPQKVPEPIQFNQSSMSAKTPEKVTFSVTSSANSFAPLMKSGPVISNSQGSAFTPFSGSSISIASSNTQPLKPAVTSVSALSFGEGTKTQSPLSTPSLFSSSTLTTTASTKFSFGSGASVSSDLKPKSQPIVTGNTFSFGSAPAGSGISISSSVSSTSSGSQIPATSSNFAFGGAVKPSNQSNLSISPANIQVSQKPLFGVTTSTSVTSKPTSGVASIFSNLQSVIDKTSTVTVTTSVGTSKPSALFGTASGAVTTTTQSIAGSVSSTATLSLFGVSNTVTNTGSLFGSIAKPTSFGSVSIGSSKTSESNIASSTNTTLTMDSAKKVEAKLPEPAASKPETSTASNVITVSLFGSKSTVNEPDSSSPGTLNFGTASAQTIPTPSTIFETAKDTISSTESPAVTTKPSIFASSAAPTGSIFGSPATSTPASTVASNVFASSIPSSTSATTASNLFASSIPSSTSATTASNLFASSIPSSTSATTASTGSIFGGGSSFIGTSTKSVFGSPTTSKSIFEPKTPATSAVSSSTTTPASSVFGSPATPISTLGTSASSTAFETTKSNVFGTTPSGSVFGSVAPSTTGNIFASASGFGTPTTSSSGNAFSSSLPTISNTTTFATPTTTSSSNVFGSPVPATKSGVFGGTTSTSTPFGTQSGSIFGTANTAGSGVFGQPATFGTQSTFGSPATTSSSIFGQTSAFGATTGASVFGSSTSSTSVFGSTTTSSTSVFGSTTTSSTSVFGSTTTPSTTSGNIFASAVPSNSGFGSGFGAASPTTFGSATTTQPSSGSFGFGGLSVGSTSSSGSIFGGNSGGAFGQAATSNPFGKVEAKSTFGASSGSIFGSPAATSASTNIFGSPATTASSIFGSSSTSAFGTSSAGGGFGATNTFGASPFGQKPAFGQPAAFSSPSTFGSPQAGGAAGAFSGGATSPVAQSGFGSPATFQKSSGFGSAPVFGGSPAPAFGSSATFGGTASFGGGASTFGSPEKVFGSPQPATGGFGAAPQQNAGFGNLASQNTIGFGNLAQQANTSTSMPFSGSSSFSSWR